MNTINKNRIQDFLYPENGPRIVSIGTANPGTRYSQEEIVKIYHETNPVIVGLFQNSHIKYRHLILPEPVDGIMQEETQEQLIRKHRQGAEEFGAKAITECLSLVNLTPRDIDFLCCVSSTGFLCPGITARLIKKMNFRENVHRIDILGMGCNAGLNAINPVVSFARCNPGKNALMVCTEICSAAYVYNKSINTAVVNSLFGDGVAAVLVRQDNCDTWKRGPIVQDFESHIIVESIEAMKFELEQNKLSFFLDRDIPYVIGMNIEKPVSRLLKRNNLKLRHIKHWLVHSGGKKVLDAIEYNLGLTDYDVRHTLHILQNFGNLSSGSFLFSYKELCKEQIIEEGDLGVAITMGPGTTIETALLVW